MAEHHVWDVGAGGSNPLSPTTAEEVGGNPVCFRADAVHFLSVLESQTLRAWPTSGPLHRPMTRRTEPPVETLEARRLREEHTARNVAGVEAEQEGRLDEAMALYERNIAEGFAGDWPYGRLVALYERQGKLDEAERVLLRGIEVFENSAQFRTPKDRRAMVQTFKKRLTLVRKAQRNAES